VVKKLNHPLLDEHLFRQEMDGVEPLKTSPRTDSKVPRARARKPAAEFVPTTFDQALSPPANDRAHIDTDDGSSHRKNGVQKRIMQKLKRGHFPVGRQLDLHHMNTKTGHTALLKFISDAQNSALECIRIIHGKGLRSESGPRLKLMARQLLREHPQVLAFTACKPADGGSGAVDVLLKKNA
jgi:DNA-nicking Smr family endonuclease